MNMFVLIIVLVIVAYIVKKNIRGESEEFRPYGRLYDRYYGNYYGRGVAGYYPYFATDYYYPPSPCMETLFGGTACYPWMTGEPFWNPYYW
jgi:hypothetical protein